MSERTFEPMTKAEVVAAQRAWAEYVIEQDIDRLLKLYDFGTPDEPLLFKPTLADVIRLDRAGYTFAYYKLDGRVLISLHHSSLTWLPAAEP